MVRSLIEASLDRPMIAMTPDIQEATNELRSFLFKNVYLNPTAKSQDDKSKQLLITLFDYYVKHPYDMPKLYQKNLDGEGVERCVCDFISGMTDRYAIETFNELFVPRVWRGIR